MVFDTFETKRYLGCLMLFSGFGAQSRGAPMPLSTTFFCESIHLLLGPTKCVIDKGVETSRGGAP